MRVLIQGTESLERLEILFKLAARLGENSKGALRDYFHKGHPEELSAYKHDLNLSNFRRAVERLNNVAELVEEIKELDWGKFKKANDQLNEHQN